MIVALTVEATVDVVIVKDTDAAPAGTVTLAGGVVLESLELKATTNPPAGALPLRVTVPVDVEPPTMVVGFRLKPVRLGGLMVNVAVLVRLLSVPVMVADVTEPTADVVTLNVAVVLPDGTDTEDDTTAAPLFDCKSTVIPEDGAGPVRVTVPVEGDPPKTVVGFSTTF